MHDLNGVQVERLFSPLVKFHVCIMKYAIGISQGRYLEQKMLEYKDLKKKKYKFDCLLVDRIHRIHVHVSSIDSDFVIQISRSRIYQNSQVFDVLTTNIANFYLDFVKTML